MKTIERNGFTIIVDDDVYEWASKRKWTIRDCGFTQYARGKHKGKVRYMHRIILGLTDPLIVVDHINGNGLDNRVENLRPCTNYENSLNKHFPARKTKSSKYTGVFWKKSRKKFEAHIKHKGKMIYLGLFDNEEDAARAFNDACLRLRGSMAVLNDIE